MARIVIVSPSPINGSGGIRTILIYAAGLKAAGYQVTVSFLSDGLPLGPSVSGKIEQYYGISGLTVTEFPDGLSDADLVVATRWDTPKMIRNVYAGVMVHLVQDIEGWFNPVGDAFLTAENNFLFDSKYITLGHWLAKKQQHDYGQSAFTMDFGYNPEIYSFRTPYAERPKRLCFIYQPDKPRRCTQIGIEALGIVKSKLPEYEIVFFGSDIPPYIWYPVVNLGIARPEVLAQLYNSCMVGLCISASNPSRIPFEMVACGLPVVDIFRANNLHDYDERSGILLAHQTPESLAAAVLSVVTNEDFGARMSQAGRKFSEGRSLDKETGEFVKSIGRVLNGEIPKLREDFAPSYLGRPFIAEAYDKSRAIQFCKSEARKFISGQIQENLQYRSLNDGPSNIVPVAKMLQAAKTSTPPNGVGFETVSFPEDLMIQTHPTKDIAVSAVIPDAIPSDVSKVRAVVRTNHPNAAAFQYAMALVPTRDDPDILVIPDVALWESQLGSGWITVEPDADTELTIDLAEPTSGSMDIHVSVRVPAGLTEDFAWCQWRMFSFVGAKMTSIQI